MTRRPESAGRDVATVILAVGLVTALNLIVIAILYDSIQNPNSAGISENATQILTGWGGGIVGILGVIFGYKAGTLRAAEDDQLSEVAGQTDNGAAEYGAEDYLPDDLADADARPDDTRLDDLLDAEEARAEEDT